VSRRWLKAAGLAGGLAGLLVLAPIGLRRVSFFRVRRVELVGVRYVAPEQLLARLRQSGRELSVFDDLGAIASRVRAVAGVAEARVERRLPGTLRVIVVERVPVALAPGPGGLVAVDSLGRPLPYDPVESGLDLPLVPRPDTLLTRVLARVRAADSALYQAVQTADRTSRSAVVLEVGGRRILLDGTSGGPAIRAVAAVRRHLAGTGRPYGELDGRFAGWVVVRRSGS
jgi:cell division protein FtsQ